MLKRKSIEEIPHGYHRNIDLYGSNFYPINHLDYEFQQPSQTPVFRTEVESLFLTRKKIEI